MSQNDRFQVLFRLSADHMQRLDKAAKHCGQTKQTFIQAAVLAEIAEVEERKRMKQLRIRPSTPDYEPTQQKEIDSSAPTSTLVEALRQRRQEAEPAPVATAPQGQVVVNVGGGTGVTGAVGSGDLIERLAAYITTAGNDLERDTRLRTATNILHGSAATEEERKVLVARLDEIIATKTKASEGNVLKTARAAFDKLSSMFGGSDQ